MKIVKCPIIIGILGSRGSGKTSIADYLVENYGARKFSFATPIKQLSQKIYGFSDEQIYGDWRIKEAIDERVGVSPRSTFQTIGDGVRQVVGENTWSDLLMNDIYHEYLLDEQNKNPPYIYVVDDVRRPNEVRQIKLGEDWYNSYKQGWILKLFPEDVTFSDDYANHPSETDVEKVPSYRIDWTIKVRHCDRDYEGMFSQVDEFISFIYDQLRNSGETLL